MCAENLGRRVVATGGVWIRRSIMDPLTRLAPADESAGCDPPSPPRGRGLGILRIERFVNVETSGGGLRPPSSIGDRRYNLRGSVERCEPPSSPPGECRVVGGLRGRGDQQELIS